MNSGPRFLGLGLCAVCFGVCCAAFAAETQSEKSNFGKFSTEFVTPHTPWAKPCALGPIRVLSILPNFRQRESVELWERLDSEIVPLMTFSPSKFAEKRPAGYTETFDVGEETVIAAARKAVAEDWRVALVGKSRWDSFPESLRSAILNKVKQGGAGLVIVLFTENEAVKHPREIKELLALPRTADAAWIAGAVPWNELPVLADTRPEQGVRTFHYGAGRVVALWYNQADFVHPKAESLGEMRLVLAPHERFPQHKGPDVYTSRTPIYDYYMALIAKSVLWAAGGGAQVRIQDVGVPAQPIDRDALPKTDFSLNFAGYTGAPMRVKLVLAVRDESNARQYRGEVDCGVRQGDNRSLFRLSRLKEGKHFLDVTVLDGGKVVDWASRAFRVKSPCRVADVKLDSFAVERDEQPVKGAVSLEGALPGAAKVSLDVYDALDGLVAKAPLTVQGGVYPFRFSIPDPRAALHRIHAKVEDEFGVVAEKVAEFTLPDRRFDELGFSMWGGMSLEPVFKYQLQQLKRLGVDTVMDGPHFAPAIHKAAEIGMKMLPYTFTAISWYKMIPGEHVREKCLVSSDEHGAWHAGAIRRNADYAAKFDPYSPAGYWLGEESYLGMPGDNLCFCDKCMAAFRDYLKTTYGTVEALNRSWGTELKDFSAATPLALDDALKANQLPRWADFRRCMELRFTKITTDIADAMIQANPKCLPGSMSTCVINSDTGFDYWVLMSHLREFGPQPFGTCEQVEARYATSFVRPPRRIDSCYGYNSPEDRQSIIPWFALALGHNGLFYYHVGNANGQGGFATLTATLERPSYLFGLTIREVQEIQRGIDKLLFTSARNDDAVRVLYSQMSLHASTAGNPKSIWWPGLRVMEGFYCALEDAGIQHGTISYQEVLDGKLKYPEVKALMLPNSKALSAGEAKAIRDFCESGGLVVTSTMPGVMDEHLKTLAASPLAGMFPDARPLSVAKIGKGKAVYLGDLVNNYAAKHHAGAGVEVVDALTDVLETSGIRPAIKVLSADGKPQVEVRPVLFTAGANNYVLLVRERKGTPPVTVSVKFPRAGFIYDVRAGRLLAEGDTAPVTVAQRRVDLVAQLPYKVEGLRLSAAARADRRFQVSASVQASSAATGHHVLYLTLSDPAGRLLPCYARRVLAAKGDYSGIFTVALNEPAGEYTLTAKDVASGATQGIPIQIK